MFLKKSFIQAMTRDIKNHILICLVYYYKISIILYNKYL